MRTVLSFLAICAVVIVLASWGKYGSLDPCSWVLPSIAAEAGMPREKLARVINGRAGSPPAAYTAWAARLHRQSTGECLMDWANLRLHGLEALKSFDEPPIVVADHDATPGRTAASTVPPRDGPPQRIRRTFGATDKRGGYTAAERSAMQRLINRKQ